MREKEYTYEELVESEERVNVMNRVSGSIAWILVESGQYVNIG